MTAANVADVISRHAAATPLAVAVEDRGRTITYGDFDAAISRAAEGVAGRGIRPGDVVGVSLGDSALHLVAGYALARMGAVQVSLPRREAQSVRSVLASRFGVRLVLCEGAAGRLPGIDSMTPDPAWLAGAGVPAAVNRGVGGDMPWKIVMTSGTTGQPKAVLQTHAMHIAWRRINQQALPLHGRDRYLALVALDFFAGFRSCTEVHWAGGTVVVCDAPATAEAAVRAIETHRPTFLYLMPVHLEQLLRALPAAPPRFPSARVRTGGMVVGEALRAAVRSRITPDLRVGYGTNEVGSPFTVAAGETLDRFPGTLGAAVPGVELQVVDEDGRPLPAGQPGRIRVRMAGMANAYMDNPAATARTFRDGWYYPGDLGELDAHGMLYFRGRVDDLMNYDGLKIYPDEIEDVLHAHADVVEAAAFPLASDVHQHVPAAVAVSRGADAQALARYCAERLGVRAPQRIVVLPELPRTAAGKVDKRRAAQLVMERLKHGR